MILRVVSGRVSPGALGAVSDSFRRSYVPAAERSAGLARFVVSAGSTPDGGHDLAAMTVWATVEDALAAYGGNLTVLRTLDAADHGVRMTKVDLYEVDSTAGAGLGSGRPTILRLTAGRVARGFDADIQQELRRHLPEMPAEALEGWVGRRVLDNDVEIAFVSTWNAAPAGRSLEQPIWPSISDRYDTFRVVVQTILVEGVGPG